MLDYIKSHLDVLVPTILPVAFFFANLAIKLMLGQTNFHFFGSDMALCGSAVYTGTFLRQILNGRLTDSRLITINVLGLIGVLFVWFVCAWTGSKGRWWLSWLAAVGGIVLFSLCDKVSWDMLSTGASK